MSKDLIAKITAISRQLFLRKGLRSTNRLARNAAARGALAPSVPPGLHLHVVQIRPKRAEEAAMVRHVAIPVGGAFPEAHRRQVRRLKRRHVPLVDGVVRDTIESDLPVAP